MNPKQLAILDKLAEQKARYGHGRLNHWILDSGEWIYWFDVRPLVDSGHLKMTFTGFGEQAQFEFELA
jgi:hypothetical protein